MDIQPFLNAIKDYGAAIISTISVGGVAGAVAVIVKVKKAIDDTKDKVAKMNEKKAESEAALANRYAELTTIIKDQNAKIDTLTEEVSRVKGNRKN